jgi:hypothetical protein
MTTRALAFVAVAWLAGCAGPGSEPTAVTTSPEEALDRVVQGAIADLAGRLGVQPASLAIVMSERVTWPDSSLGCPAPGRRYTPATVEGYRVVLLNDRRLFRYYAGDDGVPSLCPSGEKDGGYDFVPPPGFDE